MSKKTKIVLMVIGVIVVSVTGLALLGQWIPDTGEQEEAETVEETSLPQQYPDNLIEGIVKAVDLEGRTLRLEAKTSLIETAEKDVMEKTIKFTDDTEWVIYHMASQEESPFEFSEIKVDDGIVVVTVESTFDKINELEEFTAIKISKIVSE